MSSAPEGEPLKTQWSWAPSRHSETWEGPFGSREAAIARGRQELPGELGFIAPCVYPDPADHAQHAVDIEDVLERMDQLSSDDGFYVGDDRQFEAKEGAVRALELALAEWAKEWVRATVFTAQEEKAEPVTEYTELQG